MEGYQPFVYAFNHALQALHNIDVPLRKSTNSRLLFLQNDPEIMTTTHLSYCNPDIILVTLDAAQNNSFSEAGPGSWEAFALKAAAESPKNSIRWDNILSVGELRRNKCTLPSPPPEYVYKIVEEIPPQAVLDAIYETPEDLFAHKECARPSDEAMQKPLSDTGKMLLTNILIVH